MLQEFHTCERIRSPSALSGPGTALSGLCLVLKALSFSVTASRYESILNVIREGLLLRLFSLPLHFFYYYYFLFVPFILLVIFVCLFACFCDVDYGFFIPLIFICFVFVHILITSTEKERKREMCRSIDREWKTVDKFLLY